MILVGTVHIDIEGPNRLMKLLEKYNPEIISIECPSNRSINEVIEYIDRERTEMSSQVNNSNLPENLKKLVLEYVSCSHYEAPTAIDYAKKSGSKLHFVDYPGMVLQKEFDISDALTTGNMTAEEIERLNKMPYDTFRAACVKQTDKTYFNYEFMAALTKNMSKKSLDKLIEFTKQITNEKFAEDREEFMAIKISELKPSMHIGGMIHMFEYEGNISSITPLYKRLTNIPIQRIRLCEPDKIYTL